MIDLREHEDIFAGLEPYRGTPPRGFYPDWIGALTDARFRAYLNIDPDTVGGEPVETHIPTIADGEGWFEAYNWVAAAREARDRFVMVTLGACYGAQAVGSYLALQRINPMPAKLVAVEPEPENLRWVAEHFRNNGIDPDDHWLIGLAIGGDNQPTLFPVGSPGSGAQNAISTNSKASRLHYCRMLTLTDGGARRTVRNILLNNSLGLRRDLLTGREFGVDGNIVVSLLGLRNELRAKVGRLLRGQRDRTRVDAEPEVSLVGDITLMSTVTLHDVLGPFDRVDYLEADMQQSEIVVFPPAMEILNRKVRRVHIGTHGTNAHRLISELFRQAGWEFVFDFEPNSSFVTNEGTCHLNDGILTVLNPRMSNTCA